MTPLNVTMMVLIPLAVAAVLGFVAFSGRLDGGQRRAVERSLRLVALVLVFGMAGWSLFLAIQLHDWIAVAAIVAFAALIGGRFLQMFRRASAGRRPGA
jgi:CHASE2 domain-containing sensor protein